MMRLEGVIFPNIQSSWIFLGRPLLGLHT